MSRQRSLHDAIRKKEARVRELRRNGGDPDELDALEHELAELQREEGRTAKDAERRDG
jgi:predicted  nucleic acid-binding Zn-ribbon protein